MAESTTSQPQKRVANPDGDYDDHKHPDQFKNRGVDWELSQGPKQNAD
jgi:hypothetical protein